MKKLNYFSPLPPLKSGISDYSEELLKELSKHFDITAYVDDFYKPKKSKYYKIKNHKKFKNSYPAIYNIGNHKYHAYIYNTLLKHKGIIILHDSNLHHLNFSMQGKYWRRNQFLNEVYFSHGLLAYLKYRRFIQQTLNKKTLEEYEKRENDSYIGDGWNQIEKIDGINFRWTEKRASFKINDEDITELKLRVYSEFPTGVILIINKKMQHYKITRGNYQWISIKIPPTSKIIGRIIIFKPLSFVSKIINKDKRSLGIRVAEIKYKTKNRYKTLDISNQFILTKNGKKELAKSLKFSRLKEKIICSYPLNKRVIKSARAIITHSNHLKNIAGKIDKKIPIKVINEGVNINMPKISKKTVKKKLRLEEPNFIICSFGFVQKHKRIEQALEAFSRFSEKNRKAVYVIIGSLDETIDINKIIKQYNLKNKVIITGYIPFKKAVEYIYVSDVCINLRFPSTGATSASLIKSLSIGTPCIITNIPENEQFPKTCVFKIKKNNSEIENIIKALEFLKNNPDIRETMSENAIKYIKENHLWVDKAKEIRDFIYEVYNENSNNKPIGRV